MIIIKIEEDGGLWSYKEFDDKKSAAIFLLKNPKLKLRVVSES